MHKTKPGQKHSLMIDLSNMIFVTGSEVKKGTERLHPCEPAK